MSVIYDADFSGRFLPLLTPCSSNRRESDRDKRRILISGTSDDQQVQKGISFSGFFWQAVLSGDTVWKAFLTARDAVGFSSGIFNRDKMPQLDDNGNGIGNEISNDSTGSDGLLAADYTIGLGIKSGTGVQTADGTMNESLPLEHILEKGEVSKTIQAENIATTNRIEEVWAVIIPPGYESAQTGGLESLLLADEDGDGTYTQTYDFSDFGFYEVTIYVRDTAGTFLHQKTRFYQPYGPDSYEKDNRPGQANFIVANDAPQHHSLHRADDADWVRFYSYSEKFYTVKAAKPITQEINNDIVIEVYRDPESEPETEAMGTVTWQIEANQIYYVKICYRGSDAFKDAAYDLEIYPSIGVFPGYLKGVIRDSFTGKQIGGAKIKLNNIALRTTLPDGTYRIVHEPAEYLEVRATADGYNTSDSRQTSIKEGGTTIEDFELEPDMPPLDVLISNPTKEQSTNIYEGEAIHFKGSVNQANSLFTYEWDFDGGFEAYENENHTAGTVLFETQGNYTIVLTVRYGRVSNDAELNITVSRLPSASIESPSEHDMFYEGEPVLFEGKAEGGYGDLSYLWDFGNGKIAHEQSPQVIFEPGIYTAKLTVTDANGKTSEASIPLNIMKEPEAEIISPPSDISSINAGDSIVFQGKDESLDFLWTFGNSGIPDSEEKRPSVTFDNAGDYTVILKVIDANGHFDTDEVTVTINENDTQPVAKIISPASDITILAGKDVFFEGAVTDGNPPFDLLWDFSNSGIADSAEAVPGIKIFDHAGDYTISFRTTDTDGDTSEASVTVRVKENFEPLASIVSPPQDITVNAGEPVSFEGTVMSGNAPFSFLWNFGNSGIPDSAEAVPGIKVFDNAGDYTISFKATDADGDTSEASVTVRVKEEDAELIASILSPPSDISVSRGKDIDFQGSATGGTEPFHFLWNFGDSGLDDSTEANPGMLGFDKTGVYTVTLTVSDKDGEISTDSVKVTINEPAPDTPNTKPVASINHSPPDLIISKGTAVNFQGIVTGGDAPFSYLWDFNGGAENSYLQYPGNVVFQNAGDYAVTFTVRDKDGDTSSASINLTVKEIYAITASAGLNGTISPSGSVTVREGDSQTFAIQPADGYETEKIIVDGESKDPANAYTFTDIKADHEIRASFKKNLTLGHIEGRVIPNIPTVLNTTGGGSAETDSEGNYHLSHIPGEFELTARTEEPGYKLYTADVEISEGKTTHLDIMLIELPSASISYPPSEPFPISEGDSVDFKGDVTGGSPPFEYSWDFNGGAENSDKEDPGNIIFRIAGNYQITFAVSDADNDKAEASITIVVVPKPIKPELKFPYNGEADVSFTSGKPELSAEKYPDPHYTHVKTQWQISKTAGFSELVFDITSAAHLTSLTVPECLLDGSTEYYWRVRFYNDQNQESEWSDEFSFTTSKPTDISHPDTADLDNNGIPDITQEDIESIDTFDRKAQMGIKIPKGVMIESVRPYEQAKYDKLFTGADNRTTEEMKFGLISFRLKIPESSDTVKAIIYCSEILPDEAKWYQHDSVSGWQDYSDYTDFSTDGNSVALEFKDGGFGDADGTQNGFIVHSSGPRTVRPVYSQSSPPSGNAGGAGCFITVAAHEGN